MIGFLLSIPSNFLTWFITHLYYKKAQKSLTDAFSKLTDDNSKLTELYKEGLKDRKEMLIFFTKFQKEYYDILKINEKKSKPRKSEDVSKKVVSKSGKKASYKSGKKVSFKSGRSIQRMPEKSIINTELANQMMEANKKMVSYIALYLKDYQSDLAMAQEYIEELMKPSREAAAQVEELLKPSREAAAQFNEWYDNFLKQSEVERLKLQEAVNTFDSITKQ